MPGRLPLATLGEIAATAPVSFFIGVFVGWLVSQRYRVVRKNGEEK